MRSKVLTLLVTALLFVPTLANGWNLLPDSWASGKIPFDISVDAGSFANLNGRSLTSAQALYWVGAALKEWKVRTGADFDVNSYIYTTARTCRQNSDGHSVVGVSTASATTTCGHPNAVACYIPKKNIWGNITAADICVVGNAASWEVIQEQLSSSNLDLLYVLIHEFGHFLGLAHTNGLGAIMSDEAYLEASSGRHLFGDDIEGIRAIYGSRGTQRHWRQWNGTTQSMSAPTAFGGTNNWQRSAASVGGVSTHATQHYLVAATINRAGDRQYFHRADYPLNSSSGWTGSYISTNSWSTAGIASNGLVGTNSNWTTLWPSKLRWSTSTCSMSGGSSKNAFLTSYTPASIAACSHLSPALAYDPNSSRYIAVWKNFDASTGVNSGRMYARTSLDGHTWTSTQDLGLHSLDAPSVTCHTTTGCVLSYARASTLMPQVVTRKIIVNAATGVITNGTWTSGLSGVQHTPVIGAYTYSGRKFLTLANVPTGVQQPRGSGNLWYGSDGSNPPSISSWSFETVLDHPPAYAGSHNFSTGFVLTADY